MWGLWRAVCKISACSRPTYHLRLNLMVTLGVLGLFVILMPLRDIALLLVGFLVARNVWLLRWN
jgi:hypothetical protein